jgi:hypothetical protein
MRRARQGRPLFGRIVRSGVIAGAGLLFASLPYGQGHAVLLWGLEPARLSAGGCPLQ